MSTPVTLGYALWQDGETFNGLLGRQLDVAGSWFCTGTSSALTVQGGVINSVGGMQVVTGSGMHVTVNAGFAIVPNTTSATNGGYKCGSLVSNSVGIDTSDPTNPRIDLIVIAVNDPGTSAGYQYLQAITGTPAPSPVAPAAPANSVTLAQVRVNAGVTTISSGNITDKRVFTAAAGGVVGWPSTSVATGGHNGNIAYDIANNRFFHNATNGPAQFRTLPWPPAYATLNSSYTTSTSVTTVLSTNINTDGQTDIMIRWHWPAYYQPSSLGVSSAEFSIWVDSTIVESVYVGTSSAATGSPEGGGTSVYQTSSLTGDTPSAGPHTVYWKVQVNTGYFGQLPLIYATSIRNAYLYVSPAVL